MTEKPKSGSARTSKRADASARSPQQGGEAPSATRHEMIATAAYLRAEQRGFCGGDSLDDWLAAEAEVDERLRQSPARQN